MLMKETEDYAKRWEKILCFWTGRINIVKMTILSNTIYRVSVIPIKSPMEFFTQLGLKKNSKFVSKHKRLNSQRHLEKEK